MKNFKDATNIKLLGKGGQAEVYSLDYQGVYELAVKVSNSLVTIRDLIYESQMIIMLQSHDHVVQVKEEVLYVNLTSAALEYYCVVE